MLIESCITDAFGFYKKLRRESPYTALLESLGNSSEGQSLYTFIGACPRKVLTVREGEAFLLDLASGAQERGVDWKHILDSWAPLGAEGAHQPYQTGCIGYVGYDRKDDFERYTKRIPRDTQVPDVCLVLYGAVLVVDRDAGSSTWVVDDETLAQRVVEYERLAVSESLSTYTPPFALCGDIETDTSEEQHRERIEQIIEYIKAGDVFQVNFTARYRGKYQGDVIHLYETLRTKTPNPYFALLDFPHPLISTSPERFLKVEGQRISASPIKGTLCCEINGEDQRATLASSIKNRAENVMIADLMRNDLGRICEQGSVDVDELCAVRRFNQLYHLESTISGYLRASTSISDVLAATFPCGSITGAPKIRSVEIIEELESSRRGPYCGAVGFFGSQGWMHSCVGIRIIYFDEEHLYFHAGGGIVVDSSAADEYAELKLKAESIKSTLESFNVMNDIRRKIDQIDDELFKVVSIRFKAIQEACRIKAQYGVPVVQHGRMAQMITSRSQQFCDGGSMPEAIVSDLYAVLTEHSMELERRAQS